MLHALVLPCLLFLLTACEPCAVVVGSHCQDRQHDDSNDDMARPRREGPQQPTTLWPRQGARG